MQERYWNTMVQAKFSCYYLEMQHESSVKMERSINIFLAIMSCGSIAGWAIWNRFAIIWAILVAFSQVISAILHFLPYSKRAEELFKYCWELNEISRKMEHDWFAVASGDLSEHEINEQIDNTKKETNAISYKYLNRDYLQREPIIKDKADKMTEEYFERNF